MKVILLAPTPPPAGGIAAWTLRMQSVKLKNGWEVIVVDEKVRGNRDVFGENSEKNIFVEIKRCCCIWKELWENLYDDEVKIVHSCIPAVTAGMLREWFCAVLTKTRGKKFIIHFRCTLPNMVKSKIGMFMLKLLVNISDLAIVLNKDSLDFVKKYCKTNAILIPNFIEKGEIFSGNEKIITEKVQRILYVGNVVETKGCCDIIKVAEKFPKIQFRLVGKPENKIVDMLKPLNVILLGEKYKLDVKKELDEADLFMFVTYFPGEGFSNALAEAMAAGLPCIVSDWAANKDMIENKGGIVVPVKDTDAMIDAINKLIENKQLRQKQSKWNIDKIISNYIDDIVTDMYVDEYENLLKESSYNVKKNRMGS